MKKVYCIIRCFTPKKIRIKAFIQDGLCVEELTNLRGAYTWSKTSVQEKEGLSAEEGGGGGLIGREIQYAVQSHLNKYNFQIQWIILQL